MCFRKIQGLTWTCVRPIEAGGSLWIFSASGSCTGVRPPGPGSATTSRTWPGPRPSAGWGRRAARASWSSDPWCWSSNATCGSRAGGGQMLYLGLESPWSNFSSSLFQLIKIVFIGRPLMYSSLWGSFEDIWAHCGNQGLRGQGDKFNLIGI